MKIHKKARFTDGKWTFGIGIIILLIIIYLNIKNNSSILTWRPIWRFSLIAAGSFLLFLGIINSNLDKSKKIGYGLAIVLLTIGTLSILYSGTPSEKGLINIFTDAGKGISQIADSSFSWLFGTSIGGAFHKITGVREEGLKDFLVLFFIYFVYAFFAALIMYFGKFLLALFGSDEKDKLEVIWIDVIAGNTANRLIFALGFATLMQIGIINRFIQIITFYPLVNWFIYPFVLAIYFGYLPEIIAQASRYYWYWKARRTVLRAKTVIKIQRLQSKV